MRRVLLCGKSLLISGLRASLAAVPALDLHWADAQPELLRAQIIACQPQVLIIETRLLHSDLSLALLHDFPQMKLIGLDIEDNRLLVFSGQAEGQPTFSELLQVIEGG